MPAAFLGHGSPMNTLEHNRYTESWRAFGAACGRPRAILCISAHWFIHATAVTAMARPRVIHDFYGFPDQLFAFDYPAPGAPEVAEEVAEVVKPHWVGLDHDSWGIDHGTWSVLAHAFPGADIPVVQLSINAQHPLDVHVDIGARLAPLRDSGVLIVGSGNIVHNLRLLDPRQPERGFDWAERFDESAREVVSGAPGDVLKLAGHADVALAVPTTDHFVPLLYFAGLAAQSGTQPATLVDGYTFGSLSMTSFTLDAPPTQAPATGPVEPPAPLPGPSSVPPEERNI
jgi:4,5-DOPA dioxygenase extradiol